MNTEASCCPICFSRYNAFINIPKSLPSCSHSLCADCLAVILTESKPRCPFDRIPIPATFNRIDAVPSNLALIQHMDACIDAKPNTCSIHSLPIKFYCLTDKVQLCKKCMLLEHKGHDFEILHDLFMEAAKKTRSLSSIKGRIRHYEKDVSSLLEREKQALWTRLKSNWVQLKDTFFAAEEQILAEIGVVHEFKRQKTEDSISFTTVDKKLESSIMALESVGMDQETHDYSNVLSNSFFDAYHENEDVEPLNTASEQSRLAHFEKESRCKTISALNSLYDSVTNAQSDFRPFTHFPSFESCTPKDPVQTDPADILKVKLDRIQDLISCTQEGKILKFGPYVPNVRMLEPSLQTVKAVSRVDVNFSNMPLKEDQVQSMCYLWEQIPEITDLTMDLQHADYLDFDLEVLCLYKFWIQHRLSSLTIRLRSTQVCDRGLAKLFNKLWIAPNLRSLDMDLANTNLTDIGMKELTLQLIPQLHSLKHLSLNLVGTALSAESANKLCNALANHLPKLLVLKLALSHQVYDTFLLTLDASLFVSHPNLTMFELILTRSYVTDQGAMVLFKNISDKLKCLEVVAFSFVDARITDDTMITFVDKCHNRAGKLKRLFLDFKNTDMTYRAVKILIEWIAKNLPRGEIVKLDFRQCAKLTPIIIRMLSEDVILSGLTGVSSLTIEFDDKTIHRKSGRTIC